MATTEATTDDSDRIVPFGESSPAGTLENEGFVWEEGSRPKYIRVYNDSDGKHNISFAFGVMRAAGWKPIGVDWDNRSVNFKRK